MMVKCPTCKKLHEYDMNSPWRPFCSERCKLIDLGAWASGDYVIRGEPGSADPDLIVEQLEKMQKEQEENERKKKYKTCLVFLQRTARTALEKATDRAVFIDDGLGGKLAFSHLQVKLVKAFHFFFKVFKRAAVVD